MQILYPNAAKDFSIPIRLDETKSAVVFEVSHRDSEATIYWHLDEVYIGSTKEFHEKALSPEKGIHELTLVDNQGEIISMKFNVIE